MPKKVMLDQKINRSQGLIIFTLVVVLADLAITIWEHWPW